jgi:hypothetical protein
MDPMREKGTPENKFPGVKKETIDSRMKRIKRIERKKKKQETKIPHGIIQGPGNDKKGLPQIKERRD